MEETLADVCVRGCEGPLKEGEGTAEEEEKIVAA